MHEAGEEQDDGGQRGSGEDEREDEACGVVSSPSRGAKVRRCGAVPDVVAKARLAHPIRQEILGLLDDTPGLNKEQVYQRIDEDRSSVRFHLRRLVELDRVATRTEPGRREIHCFLVEDAPLWGNPRTRILYGRPENRHVALYLVDHPGSTTPEIARALDRKPATVRYHLRQLRSRGLVIQYRVGRKRFYGARSVLEAWVDEIGHAFDRPWGNW